LGITYAKIKQYQDAIRSFEYAILADEYFTAAYYEMARVYENMDMHSDAAEVYVRSMEFDDPTGYIYYRLGHCYMKNDNVKQAIRYLKRAIKEDEELDEAYIELAAIQAITGDSNAAYHNLQKALNLDPENPDYLYTAVEIYEQIDYKLDAVQAYKNIIEAGFDDDEMYMDYAELLVEMDEVDDALHVLLEGIEKYPESQDMHLMIAGYMLATGDHSGGVSHLIEANLLDEEAIDRFVEYFPELLEEQRVQVIIREFKSGL
jgi:tetratricopeptide (TPR) repeat protein